MVVVVSSEVEGGRFSYSSRQEKARVDADGDLEVPRLEELVLLERSYATEIGFVGEQVWRGGLLLCDWLAQQELVGRKVLELGAGVGAASIFAARRGAAVTLTDACESALEMARRNADRNGVAVDIRHLDWFAPWAWFDRFDLIVAADVIYDDRATLALFEVLKLAMTDDGQRAILVLELRFNFEVESLSVVAHGYRLFRKLASAWFRDVSRLPLPPECLSSYDRGGGGFGQLEIWELSRCRLCVADSGDGVARLDRREDAARPVAEENLDRRNPGPRAGRRAAPEMMSLESSVVHPLSTDGDEAHFLELVERRRASELAGIGGGGVVRGDLHADGGDVRERGPRASNRVEVVALRVDLEVVDHASPQPHIQHVGKRHGRDPARFDNGFRRRFQKRRTAVDSVDVEVPPIQRRAGSNCQRQNDAAVVMKPEPRKRVGPAVAREECPVLV